MTWICECKYWKNAIPKEKVLTFYGITKDLGVDKGFLFSESGFQSGAIRYSKNTNITLTSIDEIKELIQDELQESLLINNLKRIETLRKRLKESWIDDLGNPISNNNSDFDKCLSIDGTLMFTTLQIQKAINKDFPIYLTSYSMESKQCQNLEELNMVLSEDLEILEIEVDNISKVTADKLIETRRVIDTFSKSIKDLLKSSENQLFEKKENIDKQVMETLTFMKSVGKNSDELKTIVSGTLSREVHKMMRLLIDLIYPHLTKVEMERQEWDDSKKIIINQVKVLNEK